MRNSAVRGNEMFGKMRKKAEKVKEKWEQQKERRELLDELMLTSLKSMKARFQAMSEPEPEYDGRWYTNKIIALLWSSQETLEVPDLLTTLSLVKEITEILLVTALATMPSLDTVDMRNEAREAATSILETFREQA